MRKGELREMVPLEVEGKQRLAFQSITYAITYTATVQSDPSEHLPATDRASGRRRR